MLATVVVRPIGKSYLQGAQNSNGSCSSGTTFDALARVDLDVELVAPDRTTVLASVDAAPAGEVETLSKIPLSSGAGIYYVRVDGGGADDVQLYRLDVELTAAAAVPIVEFGMPALPAGWKWEREKDLAPRVMRNSGK